MKKKLLWFAVLLLTVSLCGLSAGGAQEGPVELSFWDVDSGSEVYNEWWANFVDEYEASHPDVTISKTYYEAQELDDKLLIAMSSNQEPDIFFMTTGELNRQFIRIGKFADITGLVDDSKISDGLEDRLQYEGKLYGIPLGPYTGQLWYNTKLFEKYNLDPPDTWENLEKAAEVFMAEGITPIATPGSVRWPLMLHFEYLLYQFGGADLREEMTLEKDGMTWEDPAVIKAAEITAEMAENGYFGEGFNSLGFDASAGLFMDGKAAMTLMGGWFKYVVAGAIGDDFDIDFVPYPTHSDAVYNTYLGGGLHVGMNMFAISANSKHQEAAAEFLNTFLNVADDFSAAVGYLPIGDGYTPEDYLTRKEAEHVVEAAAVFGPGDRDLPPVIVEDYLNLIQGLSAGTMTPQEFGKQMADLVKERKEDF